MAQSNSSSQKPSAINLVFVGFIAVAVIFAAYTNNMKADFKANYESAETAVELAIGAGFGSRWFDVCHREIS